MTLIRSYVHRLNFLHVSSCSHFANSLADYKILGPGDSVSFAFGENCQQNAVFCSVSFLFFMKDFYGNQNALYRMKPILILLLFKH